MDWERIISDYLDDLLPPEETVALFQWIRSHPDNARQFARAAFLHRCLRHRLSAMRALEEGAGIPATSPYSVSSAIGIVPGETLRPSRIQRIRSLWHRRSSWGIAAAILLLGIFAFLAWPRTSPARLLEVANATWGGSITPPRIGERLPHEELTLDAGVIKLGFSNGNQVIIEGPARFAVTDALEIRLEQGSLTAVVTVGGRGLCISAPGARVTDLGTEFGVFASGGMTRVAVFRGKVLVDNTVSVRSDEITSGQAVESSPAGTKSMAFEATAFARDMSSSVLRLNLVDLLAGGDGTGAAFGVGFDAATGQANQVRPLAYRRSDHLYHPVRDHPVVDGCFIPDGRMAVNSAGDMFNFPVTNRISYGLIWAGPNAPWAGRPRIATILPGEGTARPPVLVLHSNNAITLNLRAIRALHGNAMPIAFRARVGNSFPTTNTGDAHANPLTSIHVIVDGIARFERQGFRNTDAPFAVACPLNDGDRFLTLATTDGGDDEPSDWVLWTSPELEFRDAAR